MPEETSSEGYTSQRIDGQYDSYDSVLLRLDATPVLDSIRRFLLKQTVYDPATRTYHRAEGTQPMFDAAGVEDLMGELYTILSTDTALSVLDENDIRRTLQDVGFRLVEFLYFKADVYFIDESELFRIYSLVFNKIEIFLRRARGGKTLEHELKQFMHTEVVQKKGEQSYNEGGKSGGGFSFNPFSRRM